VKASDLRDITSEELRARLDERKKDLMNFRLQLATGVVDNVRASRLARRDIARIKTVMREREIASQQQKD
jgi:large subunit ribosomal protein L29